MADTKITALAAIGANPINVATFPIPMVDLLDNSMAASGTTKKVTVNQILGAGGTATLASATITGDLTVATTGLKIDSATGRSAFNASTYASSIGVMQSSASYYAGLTLRNSAGTYSGSIGLDASGSGGGSQDVSLVAVGTNLSLYSGNNLQYKIANPGVFTWYDGTGGTRMTLNSTGLGVGGSAAARIHAIDSGGVCALFTRAAAPAAPLSAITIQAPVSSGFSSNPVMNFWFQNAGISNPANECFAIRTSSADRLYVDAAGNVGIGVTPSAWNSNYNGLDIGQNGCIAGRVGSSNTIDIISNGFRNSAGNYVYKLATSNTACRYQLDGSTGSHIWYSGAAGTAGNTIAGFTSALMTLDASGRLLVGKTATSATTVGVELQPDGNVWATKAGSTSATTAWDTYSTGVAAYRFYVSMDGTVNATNPVISAISDARLKENVQDIDVGLAAILSLKPRKFDWKSGKGKDIKGDRGFIAQEFETVFPNLIDEWKDEAPEGEAPYKSVRADLIPVLVKAIQELTARVQTLETR